MKRAPVLVAALAAGAAALAGCSFLLDWNGYTGGTVDASAPRDASGNPLDAGADADASGDDMVADADAQPPPGSACNGSGICAPPAPSGWNGPVALYETPAGATPPSCAAGYASAPAFDGNGGLNASPASCSACTCGDPKGTGCSAPLLAFWSDNNCTTPCGLPVPLTTPACVPPPGGCNSFTIARSTPEGGTCVPAGGTPSVPPTSWSVVATACTPTAPAGSVCPGSGLCLPDPGSSPAARVCVWQTGTAAACPAGYDASPQGRLYYGDAVTDTRGCSPCTCGAPQGASCDVQPPPPSPAGFRLLTTCGTAPTIPFFVPNDCTVLTAQTFKLDVAPTLSSDAGACTPSGGQATGTASPTGPTTFCCLP